MMVTLASAFCSGCTKFFELAGMYLTRDDRLFCKACRPSNVEVIRITKKLLNLTQKERGKSWTR